jgi:hypothetical protein
MPVKQKTIHSNFSMNEYKNRSKSKSKIKTVNNHNHKNIQAPAPSLTPLTIRLTENEDE